MKRKGTPISVFATAALNDTAKYLGRLLVYVVLTIVACGGLYSIIHAIGKFDEKTMIFYYYSISAIIFESIWFYCEKYRIFPMIRIVCGAVVAVCGIIFTFYFYSICIKYAILSAVIAALVVVVFLCTSHEAADEAEL